MKLAYVATSPLKNNIPALFTEYLSDGVQPDIYYLSSEPKEKILKKDVTLNIDSLKEEYDLLIPVGAESLKYVCGLTGITKYNGTVIEGKYLPVIDPAMTFVKPQYKDDLRKAFSVLDKVLKGEQAVANKKNYYHFTDAVEFLPYLQKLQSPDIKVISVDTETTSLSPRKGSIIGFVISTAPHEGTFIDASIVNYYYDEFYEIFKTKKCVFHNAKFDIQFISYEYGFEFPDFEDTMLMHYILDESVGTHGLKALAMKFTDLGDYEKELDDYKKLWCRQNKLKLEDFNYGMIPVDILARYACADGDATMQLYHKFQPKVYGNSDFVKLYEKLLKPVTETIVHIENNGGPICVETLDALIEDYKIDIEETIHEINLHPAVQVFESTQHKQFNPNSIYHLREVLFNILGIKPIKKTATGANSTDAEVLGEIDHPLAEAILDLRKKVKLSQTYLKNIRDGLDYDNRLRSSFNTTGTTSGRLSSSGILNYQNLPRDKDSGIKKVFKARKGYKIVQCDLGTAEVWVAAALSNDRFLQEAFVKNLDFHSYVAHSMFNLPCEIHEVKKLFPDERQWAKAIN